MRNQYEMDYFVHEYYRQTGKLAEDSLDSWVRAVRFVQRQRRPQKGPKTSRPQEKKR